MGSGDLTARGMGWRPAPSALWGLGGKELSGEGRRSIKVPVLGQVLSGILSFMACLRTHCSMAVEQ